MEAITIDQLINKINNWSTSHGLNEGDSYKQMIKITEEVGELAQGLLKSNDEQILDSIGDIFITLAVFCQQRGLKLADAIDYAYRQVEHRKGSMVNGTFIKEEASVSPMDEIIEVGPLLANSIIKSRKPYGKFWCSEELDLSNNLVYIAIDNRTGDAWTEEFHDKEKMLAWLRGDTEIDFWEEAE